MLFIMVGVPRRGITTHLFKKVGSFFYNEKGEKVYLFPENFHLAEGEYYVNIVNDKTEVIGDKTFYHVSRILKKSQ